MIKEWNLLRVVACLSIVLLHSTTQIGNNVGYPEIDHYHFYRILLCYATPAFIVLSEIILANRYPSVLPQNFWGKRIKYILIPYFAFAIIDAFVVLYLSPNINLNQKIIDNIIFGRFEGFFILIIFQFYILHYLVTKFRLSTAWMIPLSIYLMVFYLDMVKLKPELVSQYGMAVYIPFLAWFAYFTIAYAVGQNYTVISSILLRYRWGTVLLFLASIAIMFISYQAGSTDVSSKRYDLLLFVIATSAMILAWGQIIPNFRITNMISNYSFGIYLLHWQVQRLVGPYIAEWFDRTSTRLLALFVASLLISMLIIKLISFLPFGSYIIGQLKKTKFKQGTISKDDSIKDDSILSSLRSVK